MYEAYFKFASKPFRLSPDARFFYASKTHSKALAYLNYALEQNEGFLILTGEPGTGKTTLLQSIKYSLPSRNNIIADISSTNLNADALIALIARSFGMKQLPNDKAGLIHELGKYLTNLATQKRRAIVFVDEAQHLSLEALEELRMLSNFQKNNHSLIQCFLIGQPALQDKLSDPTLKQLRQRIIAACHLQPLDAEDTQAYIAHRMQVAGMQGLTLFSPDAIQLIYDFTQGTPRRINRVCDRALLLGYLEEKSCFDRNFISRVIAELCDEMEEAEQDMFAQTNTAQTEFVFDNLIDYTSEETDEPVTTPQAPPSDNQDETQTQGDSDDVEDVTTPKAIPVLTNVYKLDLDTLPEPPEVNDDSTSIWQKNYTRYTAAVVGTVAIVSFMLFPTDNNDLPAQEIPKATTPLVAEKKPIPIFPDISQPRETQAIKHIADDTETVLSDENTTPVTESLVVANQSTVETTEEKPPVLTKTPKPKTEDMTPAPAPVVVEHTQKRVEKINKPAPKPTPKAPSPKKNNEKPAKVVIAKPAEKAPAPPVAKVAANAPVATIEPAPSEVTDKKPKIDEKALNSLLNEFKQAYEKGSMEKLQHIMAKNIKTNESQDLDQASVEYGKLFNVTETRQLEIKPFAWKIKHNSARGHGQFHASILPKGRNNNLEINGKMVVEIGGNFPEQLEIRELYYDYDN